MFDVLASHDNVDHSLHAHALKWFGRQAPSGWASCPITQNGCIRVMSRPGYPNSLPASAVMERLLEAASSRIHEFWPDDISLLDSGLIDFARIHGPRQLTDVYLLALAVGRGGQFVTFDTSVPVAAVRKAGKHHVVVL